MKRCKSCNEPLHGQDLFCPKCGAPCLQPKRQKAGKDEVIKVPAADVVLVDTGAGAPGENASEAAQYEDTVVKTAEQLAEEERAYQEDREPAAVCAQTPCPAEAEQAVPEEKPKRQTLGLVLAIIAVLAALGLAVAVWTYIGSDAGILLSYATRATDAGNFEAAVAVLEKLEVTDAENPEVYIVLCRVYEAMGQGGKALAAAQMGYDNTQDKTLLQIVTEYTFGGTSPTAQNSSGARAENASSEGMQQPISEAPAVLRQKAEVIISPMYEYADGFEDGMARVKQDGKWGFINKTNTFIVPAQYDETLYFTEDLAAVKANGKWGYLRRDGSMAIDLRFGSTLGFFEGLAAALENGKWSFIDQSGAAQLTFDEANSFSEGLAAVRLSDGWGYVNQTGELVIPAVYEDAHPFSEGVAAVLQGGRWGYIDTLGRTVITPQYAEAYEFADGIVRIKGAEKYGYINRMGWQAGEQQWDEAWNFSGGLATVKKDGLYGFVNQSGEAVIEPALEDVLSFMQGLAPFKSGGLWGYIDTEGKVAIKPQFKEASRFYEGIARVMNASDAYGYINLAGEYICLPEYDDGGICSDGMIAVEKGGKWGYLAVMTVAK